jgi:dTDP-4-dehydrorhamnose 3,5-epimerase
VELTPLEMEGVMGVKSLTASDERGGLLRVWDEVHFKEHMSINQSSVVSNPKPRTLRGLHFQNQPNQETKIILCVLGSVFDVVVDLRQDSPEYGKHFAIELGPREKYQGILVPKGFAHGYLTLEPNSVLVYFMDSPYVLESARGINWADSALGIEWPCEPEIISDRDKNLPHMHSL